MTDKWKKSLKIELKEMSTAKNTQTAVVALTAGVKEVLASSLTNLGRLHNDEYVLNRHCLESVKDIIRFLRRDNESHEIRRYLGKAKVVQTDLIHIIKTCPPESDDLFDLTIRLLTNLTNSVDTLYGDEIPTEKIGRAIYMNLMEHLQDYKEAFRDIDFWNVICSKLTDMFEIDWTERSESQCLRVEKMLVLLRNVLQIPPNPERERIADKDVSIHEKVLWSLRQSQILEFLLYLSSNKDEQRYYLHLLEIFSLILKGQNPNLLALSEVQRSAYEREKDMKDLLAVREREKLRKSQYRHARTFDSTFVVEGRKAFSGRDVIYHGSLEDVEKSVVPKDRKSGKPRNIKKPVQSEPVERSSSFSARIFLREFCIEFLNCSYNNLMSVVKEKLLSGKGLPNDETFYFWALRFFLEFNCTHNLDIKLISDSVNVQTFHYLQTHMEENFEKLACEKKRRSQWVKKLHLILKAYHSLLKTLVWMDSAKDPSVRKMSNVLKSQIFYIAEYRDMAFAFFSRYDPDTFTLPYIRDLVEVTHLSIKLLEEYTKTNKIVVRKKIAKKTKRGKKNRKKRSKKDEPEPIYEEYEVKWERIKDDIHKALIDETEFPEIAPFDVLLELTDDEQKERAMKNIQKLLHEGEVMDGIGLLRSAREVWPENDHFGSKDMSVEEELTALHEICTAELGNEKIPINIPVDENDDDEEEDEDEEDSATDGEFKDYNVTEESFDMMTYKKQLLNKKIVEACSALLRNYMNNSDYTNHCIIKIFFRIGWECGLPAMMYQASLFWTLLDIANDKFRKYKEINDFTMNLFKKFRTAAEKNKFMIVELLFWKDASVAIEIENNLSGDGSAGKPGKNGRKKKTTEEAGEKADSEFERLLGADKENSVVLEDNAAPVAESSDDDADDEAITRLREKNRLIIESQPKNKSKPKKTAPRKRRTKKKVSETLNADEVVHVATEVTSVDEERVPEAAASSESSDEQSQSRSVRKPCRIESDSESDAEAPVPRTVDLDKEFDKLLLSQEKPKDDNSDEEVVFSRKKSVRQFDSDEEEEQSKATKRRRCIDSDSDGEEEPADAIDRTKRSRVINSDSELES
ncbi:UNVERIFIED_CONTAM: hypothetical protein PYX00_004928 [Menopon gallinae]|uniref:Timeless N-terminal domain-containing protein n=1 Tax=Menopon gallinae TaxID=328185 RepID=A0AAW2I7D9_9NEOP